MIAFAFALADAAEDAGMKVPEDPEDFDIQNFPHFHVFCSVQLGAPMPTPDAHFENAKLIASLSEDEVKKVSYQDLEEKGLAIGYSK